MKTKKRIVGVRKEPKQVEPLQVEEPKVRFTVEQINSLKEDMLSTVQASQVPWSLKRQAIIMVDRLSEILTDKPTVWASARKIYLHFHYNEEIVSALKSSRELTGKGAAFNPKQKSWSLPLTQKTAVFILALADEFDFGFYDESLARLTECLNG